MPDIKESLPAEPVSRQAPTFPSEYLMTHEQAGDLTVAALRQGGGTKVEIVANPGEVYPHNPLGGLTIAPKEAPVAEGHVVVRAIGSLDKSHLFNGKDGAAQVKAERERTQSA